MKTDNEKYNEQVKSNTAFLNKLKRKLPEFFNRKDKFDLEKFENELKEKNIDELNEGYQLNFIGKDYARRQAGEMPKTVIVPDEKQNTGEGKNSKNLFFTGDNLEVLRHLQDSYSNKVDVIYIDPPYNTGNGDFIYPDNFEYTDDELKNMFGFDDEQLARLKSIQGKSSHSAWLTFMYPRLILAKNLMSNLGVIFISIDDNEQSNLKQVTDYIFGEENFIANIIVDGTPKNDPLLIATSHEYMLVYTKNRQVAKTENWGYIHPLNKKLNDLIKGLNFDDAESVLKLFFKKNNLNGDNISNYKFVDSFGIYRLGPIDDPQGKGPKDCRVNKKNGHLLKIPDRGWSCTIEKWNEWDKKNLIYYPDSDDKLPSKKTYLTNNKREVGRSVLKMQTRKTTNYINGLFKKKKIFKNPKPLKLIKYVLSLCPKDVLVLDFFAGSATTADAVMQLNAEDGGHRKFIMVQLPEPTYTVNSNGKEIPTNGGKSAYDAGFRSIDEIARERIRRAAAKIREENGLTLPEDFDGSFKHYRVVKPTKQTLENIADFDPNAIDLFTNMVDSFSSKKLGVPGDATGEQTILTTWLVKDGYSFDAKVKTIKFGDYVAHMVEDNRLYLINEGWGSKETKELLNQLGTHQLDLQSVVIFGYSFNVAELRELENGLKQLDNNVNLIKRY